MDTVQEMLALKRSLTRKIWRLEVGSWISIFLILTLIGLWVSPVVATEQQFTLLIWLYLICLSGYLSCWWSQPTRQVDDSSIAAKSIANKGIDPQNTSNIAIVFLLAGELSRKLWSLDLPHGILAYQISFVYFSRIPGQEIPAFGRYFDVARSMTLLAVFTSLIFGLIPIPVLFQSEALEALVTVLAIPLTLIFVTAFLDFYGFMNGADGLVASTVIIQAAFVALYLEQPAFVLLSATLIGFLVWNWFPARSLLGDLESNALGLIMAVTLLNGMPGNYGQTSPELFWSAIAVTFPLMGDATYTAIRRLLRKESFFRIPQAQRLHIYQRLQQVGWPDDKITLSYAGLTGLSALLVMQFDLIGSAIAALLTLSCIIASEVYFKQLEESISQL